MLDGVVVVDVVVVVRGRLAGDAEGGPPLLRLAARVHCTVKRSRRIADAIQRVFIFSLG